MRSIHKTISWILLSVMIATTAIVYICPMINQENTAAMNTLPDVCHATQLHAANMAGAATSCFGSHIAVMGQIVSDLPQIMSILLACILLLTLYRFSSRRHITEIIHPLYSRLRHWYLYYHTLIQWLIGKKILRYLTLLGNYTAMSFA